MYLNKYWNGSIPSTRYKQIEIKIHLIGVSEGVIWQALLKKQRKDKSHLNYIHALCCSLVVTKTKTTSRICICTSAPKTYIRTQHTPDYFIILSVRVASPLMAVLNIINRIEAHIQICLSSPICKA